MRDEKRENERKSVENHRRLTIEEAAREMGIRVQTVKVLERRAVEKLRRGLADSFRSIA